LFGQLQTAGLEPPGQGSLAVVASHDCDVVSRSFATESKVELLWALPVENEDGTFSRARNPRRLHLLARGAAGSLALEFKAEHRFAFTRRVLLDSVPRTDLQLDSVARAILATWLSRRFKRTALPDSFNDRLRALEWKLRKALKRSATNIENLYIALDREELPADQPYRVILRAVMRADDFGEPERRVVAQECLDELVGILGKSQGILVEQADLDTEAEFTLDDERQMLRWDFDWMSLADGD